LPVLHHPGSFPQPLGDVGAAIDDEGVDSLQGLLLSEGGHLPEWEQPAGRRGEGDNGEAVTRVIVFDHEPHGTLQERKLGARHAPTDVEHNHQIQWCSGAQPRQHMRSLQMDQDGKLLLCCGLLNCWEFSVCRDLKKMNPHQSVISFSHPPASFSIPCFN
jgi:hypothetical protein